jgi:rhamnogalacturonyl hydrolase YesR
MKLRNLLFPLSIAVVLTGCNASKTNQSKWVDQAIEVAHQQMLQQGRETCQSKKLPRSIWKAPKLTFLDHQLGRKVILDSLRKVPEGQLNKTKYCRSILGWTSGFFPGSLWYVYELTKDAKIKKYAEQLTNMLYPVSHYTESHDVGFMINCSYGNAQRLSPNDSINAIFKSTADNLVKRFDNQIGCIRSWDFGRWNFPVIIDNMMNLELLFEATKRTGDSIYYKTAVTHANTTIKHHFRSDYTTYHVVSYNSDGTVQEKCTHQGKNDASAWARGQSWAVYGYTVCYRYTHNKDYLRQAVQIADMIIRRVKTKDAIPYWDYDAPAEETTPRDASAAAVTASALLELKNYIQNVEGEITQHTANDYKAYAIKILKSLSSPIYLSEPGKNCGFILKHSTGSLPHGSEVDAPLNYADYYFLEALLRYQKENKNI